MVVQCHKLTPGALATAGLNQIGQGVTEEIGNLRRFGHTGFHGGEFHFAYAHTDVTQDAVVQIMQLAQGLVVDEAALDEGGDGAQPGQIAYRVSKLADQFGNGIALQALRICLNCEHFRTAWLVEGDGHVFNSGV